MVLLDGKKVAQHWQGITQKRVQQFIKRNGKPPGLAVVLVGDDPASEVYVRNKEKACEEAGIKSFRHNLGKDSPPETLYDLVRKLNLDNNVHGILVQLPLPKGFDKDKVLSLLSSLKDPDGLTYENMGYSWAGKSRVKSCTPQGVMEILKFYDIPVSGKHAVVIGRSNIVGKPMAQYLLEADATVTVCHSKTQNLEAVTATADILVAAAGQPRFIGKSGIKKGAVVIDVGMHRRDGKLCGDVKFEELDSWAQAATPVPGGVGPMTIAMLLKNTLDLAELMA